MGRPSAVLLARVHTAMRGRCSTRAELAEALPEIETAELDRALEQLVVDGLLPRGDYGRRVSRPACPRPSTHPPAPSVASSSTAISGSTGRLLGSGRPPRVSRDPNVPDEIVARGAAVKSARLARGWSQRDLAREIAARFGCTLGTAQSQLSSIERCRRPPSVQMLERAEAVLGLELSPRASVDRSGCAPRAE